MRLNNLVKKTIPLPSKKHVLKQFCKKIPYLYRLKNMCLNNFVKDTLPLLSKDHELKQFLKITPLPSKDRVLKQFFFKKNPTFNI